MMNLKCAGVVVLLALLGSPVLAAEAGTAEAKPAETATYTVGLGLFKVEITSTGVFQAVKTAEVACPAKSGAAMKVAWAASAGSVVKKGDPLVKLDVSELDKKIEGLEASQAVADAAAKQAKEELRLLEKTAPELLAWARRTKRVADEDFDYYMKASVPYQDRSLKLEKEGTDIWIEGMKTELAELKRMYEADDLVETTEKLVLRREQHQLDRALLDYEKRTKFQYPWQERIGVARDLEEQKKKVLDAENGLAQAEALMPAALERKRAEVKKAEHDRSAVAKALSDLRADREAAVITSPADGIVYYGRCVRGQWATAADAANKLVPGGQFAPQEVLMTVVAAAPLAVRAPVQEKDLHDLQKDIAAEVIPTGYPDRKLKGKVESLAILAAGPEPYAMEISVPGDTKPLLPGMTCQVKLRVYEKKDAIAVPAGAVFGEPADEEARYVYVQAPGAKPVKRTVKVGRQAGDRIEILEGLTKGDVVLLQQPGK